MISAIFNVLRGFLLLIQEHALLNRIESSTSEEERKKLERISSKQKFIATLLPIRTVGVQVSIVLYRLVYRVQVSKRLQA